MNSDTIPRIKQENVEPIPRTPTNDATSTAETKSNKRIDNSESSLKDGLKQVSPPARTYSRPMQQGVGERAIRHVLKECFFNKEGIDYLLRNGRIHSIFSFRALSHFDWERLVEFSDGVITALDFYHIVAFHTWCMDNPEYVNDRDYFIFDQKHLKAILNEFIPQTPNDAEDLKFKEISKKKKTISFGLVSSSENDSGYESADSSSLENNSFALLFFEEDDKEKIKMKTRRMYL